MAIVGQNTILNQYVPTFYIKDIRDGHSLQYDSVRKAFVNLGGSDSVSGGIVEELVPIGDKLTINRSQQYILTGTMEILGRVENNGRIAIL